MINKIGGRAPAQTSGLNNSFKVSQNSSFADQLGAKMESSRAPEGRHELLTSIVDKALNDSKSPFHTLQGPLASEMRQAIVAELEAAPKIHC